eukprot:scaffold211197_cov18-Tisochrysis_lutea.AAC.1
MPPARSEPDQQKRLAWMERLGRGYTCTTALHLQHLVLPKNYRQLPEDIWAVQQRKHASSRPRRGDAGHNHPVQIKLEEGCGMRDSCCHIAKNQRFLSMR